ELVVGRASSTAAGLGTTGGGLSSSKFLVSTRLGGGIHVNATVVSCGRGGLDSSICRASSRYSIGSSGTSSSCVFSSTDPSGEYLESFGGGVGGTVILHVFWLVDEISFASDRGSSHHRSALRSKSGPIFFFGRNRQNKITRFVKGS